MIKDDIRKEDDVTWRISSDLQQILALGRKWFFHNGKILGALELTVSIKKFSGYGVYIRPILGGEKRRESWVANQTGEKLFIDRAWSKSIEGKSVPTRNLEDSRRLLTNIFRKLKPGVGIRDRVPGIPQSRSRKSWTGTGTGTDFNIRD